MKTDRYTIYVGLNDGDTKEPRRDLQTLESVLYSVCKNYKVSFSILESEGGYFHANGHFIKEDSIQVILIGSTKEIANEIAIDICAFFNQESVLVVHDVVDSYMVKNVLKD